jgi:hypothetical protein
MTTDEIRRRFLKTSAMALGGGALLGPAFDRLASDVPTGPIAITHGTVTGVRTARCGIAPSSPPSSEFQKREP